MTVLSLEAVQVMRRGRALSDPVTVRLVPGSILGVVGPNGVGKSSMLGAIAQTGIETRGAIRYGDRELSRIPVRARTGIVSMLAQDSPAAPELRVRELVAIGARARGRRDDAVAEAMERVGMTALADHRVSTLSGGQRQLAHLARVLAQDAAVVVLDEPTSALDIAHQGLVEQTLRMLAGRGAIVIAAVHDLSLALNVSTDVLLLDGRGGVHHGPPAVVLHPDRVHAVYGVHTTIHTAPSGRSFVAPADHPSQEDPS